MSGPNTGSSTAANDNPRQPRLLLELWITKRQLRARRQSYQVRDLWRQQRLRSTRAPVRSNNLESGEQE